MAESREITKREAVPEITKVVLAQLMSAQENKTIVIPPNYSPENALKSAYLILQGVKTRDKKPVLQACDKTSITQALFDMVIQGLNPAKNQCYFIPYGDQLTLSRSYLGTIAVTKRLEGVVDVKGYPIYEGDKFETKFNLSKGIMEISEYEPKFENINKDRLKGAFAIVIGTEGILHTEVMSMDQIRSAWNQGEMKGNSPAHKNFTEEMAMKSVINRACKRYYSSSDDSAILTFDEFLNPVESAFVEVEHEDNANKVVIDVTPIKEYKNKPDVIEEPKKQEAKPKDSKASKPKENITEDFNEDDLPF